MPTAAALRDQFRRIPKDQREANQSFSIRVWRGLSWLERAEGLGSDDLEGRFIYSWIGLNALYGRKSPDAKPYREREALETFLAQVWRLDSHGLIGRILGRRQPAVLNLIENQYLSIPFWDGEPAPAIRKVKGEAKSAILLFPKSNREPIMRMLFERLYVMRNQIFHGASTKGGKLNRRTLQYSATLMVDLLPAFLEIMIESGVGQDWGEVMFPPREG